MKLTSTLARRGGAAIIAAMVLMAVLTVVLSALTIQIFSQRQALRQRQRQLQAHWLARAGIELAAARLLDKPAAFTEEKLELLPDTKLRIHIEKSQTDGYLVTAEAAVGQPEEVPVVRSVSAHFRRAEKDGVPKLNAVTVEKR